MTEIIEHMGDTDNWPEWAQEAMDEGRLFKECLDRIGRLEAQIEAFHTWHCTCGLWKASQALLVPKRVLDRPAQTDAK